MAEDKARRQFVFGSNSNYIEKMNESERRIHLFSVGFARGCAWTEAKHDLREE